MNKYSVFVAEKTDASACNRTIEFEFENHDDLFRIVEKIGASELFDDKQDAMQFGVGLKLFASIMMKHRNEELFKDFEPAFVEFMKKLKTNTALLPKTASEKKIHI